MIPLLRASPEELGHITAQQASLGPIQNVQLTTYSLDKHRRWTFSER